MKTTNRVSFLICLFLLSASLAFAADRFVSFTPRNGALTLFSDGNADFGIFVDSVDHKGVMIALDNLCEDFNRVGGFKPAIANNADGRTRIIVGSYDKSPVVRSLAEKGAIDAEWLKDKREKFIITTIHNPFGNDGDVLLIAGSDKRGTIYGIYELSKQMGVSPWYWWADAPVAHLSAVYINKGVYTDGEPKVKYRGLFINDEEPSFGGWSRAKFGGYNSKMYSHLFELILRLRGNYLWPAMWNSAFNEDGPMNPVLADEYGVIMGTSHHEPMMRSHQEYLRRHWEVGPWDYATNKDRIDKFFTEGIERNKGFENLITIGMRGDGDVAMGSGNDAENMKTLHKVIDGERAIIEKAYGKPASEVPQLWAIFTEVQRYYDAGFTVPDDVLLVFCDNNWGYIRRTGPDKDRNHKGGMGLYYHIDMNGGPWNDRWINTTTVPKLREQLNLAYRTGIDDLWIINVGDLKPKEYPIDFIFKYAWNPDSVPVGKEWDYTVSWAESIFGKEYAEEIAYLVANYSKYNLRRKPEVESKNIFSYVNHHEAERVLNQWKELVEKAEDLKKRIPVDAQDAYYELVYYPVVASAGVAEMYIDAGLNNLYAEQGRVSANDYADRTRELFAKDKELSDYYNTSLAHGKWEKMMSDNHIGYTKWSIPDENVMPSVVDVKPLGKPTMGVAVEGDENAWKGKETVAELPTFDSYNNRDYYFDVFNRGNGSFQFKANADKKWIMLSQKGGKVAKDVRVTVGINWSLLPNGVSEGTIKVRQGSTVVPVKVKAIKADLPEGNESFYGTLVGEYSIPANGFNDNKPGTNARWIKLPGLGRADACMGIEPVTAPSADISDAPVLEYNVFLSKRDSMKICLGILPTQDVKPERGLRIAVALDDEAPIIIDARKGFLDTFDEYTPENLKVSEVLKPLPSPDTDVALMARGQFCRNDVFDNIRWLDVKLKIAETGIHKLKVYMVDPEVVLETIVVNPDNAHPSYMGAPVVLNRADR